MSVNTRVLVQNVFEFIYAEHVFSLTHLLIFQIISCIVQWSLSIFIHVFVHSGICKFKVHVWTAVYYGGKLKMGCQLRRVHQLKRGEKSQTRKEELIAWELVFEV